MKGKSKAHTFPFHLFAFTWLYLSRRNVIEPRMVSPGSSSRTPTFGIPRACRLKPSVAFETGSSARVPSGAVKTTKCEKIGSASSFICQPEPATRFAGRSGPLKLLVVGGSLGAKALNELVPKALALIPTARRPRVTHQSGARQIAELRANYTAAGVQAELTPFIDDTAQAFADADLIIDRKSVV